VKNTKKPAKIKSPSIKSSFTGGNLTNFAGINPVFKFMKKLGIDRLIQENISIGQKPNQKYSLSQILQTIILGTFCGMDRLAKIENFTLDPVVRYLLKVRDKIDIDTLRYRLNKFSMKHNTELSGILATLSEKVHKKLCTRKDILDLDSSVKTVYGKQQGARKGFNRKDRGKRSYHPQLAFLNSTKECILAWLRPGDTHSANNAAGFMEQALSMLPSKVASLLVRADSGYFDNKLMRVIEGFGAFQYLIKVKMRNLNSLLGKQDWDKIPEMPGWEMCGFYHRCKGWEKERRFVAVRKYVGLRDAGSLFPVREYSYFCYVTNIDESPLYLHGLYGDRGNSENWIEAVKNQLYAGTILTDNFWVNETLFLLSVLAYNISVWMRKLTSEKAWRQEPLSFRLWFVQLAAKFSRSGRRRFLKMYSAYYYKPWWEEIDTKVDNLVFA
jgi:DDE family transposase